MNATLEKINDIVISDNEIEKNKEVEKNNSQKKQCCLKMLDYFIF